jgi:hypothetical protein
VIVLEFPVLSQEDMAGYERKRIQGETERWCMGQEKGEMT